MAEADSQNAAYAFWGDHFSATLFEAQPTSDLASNLRAILSRATPAPRGILAGADILGLCLEREMDMNDLAEALEISYPLAYAIACGWHRPDLSGLAVIASDLGVTLGSLVHTSDFRMRPRTTMFLNYINQEPEIPF